MFRTAILGFGMMILIFEPASAQAPDSLIMQGKQVITQAVVGWNNDGMQQARAHFERLLSIGHREALVHYYVAYCDQQLSTYHRHGDEGTKQSIATADKFLEDGIQHLEKAIQLERDFAEAYALLGSLYGEKIGASPLLGMSLGPKSGMHLAKARELAPENPRVAYLDAIGRYYTPEMFGGSKEKAISGLYQAAALFATWQSPDPFAPDWGHAECYAMLGQFLSAQQRTAEARTALAKALEIRPDYGWVKHVLLPQLDAAPK